jgi:hypothetical protein
MLNDVTGFTQLKTKKRYPDQVIGQATRNFDFIWTRLTFIKACK